jgi:hypothetical protein
VKPRMNRPVFSATAKSGGTASMGKRYYRPVYKMRHLVQKNAPGGHGGGRGRG